MKNFSTRPTLMNMPHDELVWDYVTLQAKNYGLATENEALKAENARLDDALQAVVRLYLGGAK